MGGEQEDDPPKFGMGDVVSYIPPKFEDVSAFLCAICPDDGVPMHHLVIRKQCTAKTDSASSQ